MTKMKTCTIYLYFTSTKADIDCVMYKHCTCPAFDEGHLEKGIVCFIDKEGKRHATFVDTYEVVEE